MWGWRRFGAVAQLLFYSVFSPERGENASTPQRQDKVTGSHDGGECAHAGESGWVGEDILAHRILTAVFRPQVDWNRKTMLLPVPRPTIAIKALLTRTQSSRKVVLE